MRKKKYAVKVEIYELIVVESKHKYEPVDVAVPARLFEMAVEFKGDSCCLFGAV